MTDTLLLVIISLLAVNILFVGVYIVLVLKEVRQAVAKINQILGSFAAVSNAIAHPVSQAPGIVSAIVEGVKTARTIQDTLAKRKNKVEVENEPRA